MSHDSCLGCWISIIFECLTADTLVLQKPKVGQIFLPMKINKNNQGCECSDLNKYGFKRFPVTSSGQCRYPSQKLSEWKKLILNFVSWSS